MSRLANLPFNSSDTALRGRSFLQSEAKTQGAAMQPRQFDVPPKGKASTSLLHLN